MAQIRQITASDQKNRQVEPGIQTLEPRNLNVADPFLNLLQFASQRLSEY